MTFPTIRLTALIPATLAAGLFLGCATDTADTTEAQSAASLETAAAGSAPRGVRDPGRHHGGRSDLDQNKDGTITDAERTAARKAHMTERFTADDKNKDGALTQDEVLERKWTRISQADTNGDGKVTLAELETAIESHQLAPRGPGGGAGPMGHGPGGDGCPMADGAGAGDCPMARGGRPDFDVNQDGTVTDAERAEVHKAHMTERFTADDKNKDGALTEDEVPARMWEHLSAADADNDGKLTLAEITTAIDAKTLVPRGPGGHRGGPPGAHRGPGAGATRNGAK